MLAKRLGDMLIKEKLITDVQWDSVMVSYNETGHRIVDILLEQKLVDEQNLIQFFSKNYKLAVVDLSNFEIDVELTKLLPRDLVLKHKLLPIGKRGETLVIAVSDPTNINALDDVRFQSRLKIEQSLALPSSINALIERFFGVDFDKITDNMGEGVTQAVVETDETVEGNAQDAPIIQFVSAVLSDAISRGASDIHIEPYEVELRVRLRIDGDLVDSVRPPPAIKNAIIARIKVMSKMRIDEKRIPQDGRIRYRTSRGKVVDFRVNTLPTVFGEKICMRILDKSAAVMSLDDLGFEDDEREKFVEAAKAPWGMALVTGATGSGKTTTLYAVLNMLNTPDINISTVEDPVEYNFSGINQSQMKESIGFNFATALRALLRQDPDVILVGEIRDKETAEVAMKAALTGHMVLSTLHTNNAPATIMRLKDIGIDPFMINSALRVIVAQSLVRRICGSCKVVDEDTTPEKLIELGFPKNAAHKIKVMKGTGCSRCRNTGSKGRVAIHEVMALTEKLREVIGAGGTTDDIRIMAEKEGMRTLRTNCMRKVARGLVSITDLMEMGTF